MKNLNKLSLIMVLSSMINTSHADNCRIINTQCLDNSPTKVISGISFKLSDVCSKLGLTGDKCCWNSTSQLYCGDAQDTCGTLRKNPKCVIQENECIDKDQISGTCNKFKSTYKCADSYIDVESKICTNVVCSNNESGTAKKCFNPPLPNKDNESNMGSAIAYLAMAQNIGQAMKCADPNHPTPETCSLFTGRYSYCYMYLQDLSHPATLYNNGSDCEIHKDYFDATNTPTGYAASDRALYSSATSNSTNILGGVLNYGLSNDDSTAINNSIKITTGSPVANQDEQTNYNPNSSKNSSIHISSGQVTATINKDKVKDIGAMFSFKAYLADTSVNLAWNRIKADPNPNNYKTTTLTELGVTRKPSGNAFNWSDHHNQPVINGLCVHFGDYCDGGDHSGTSSDAVKSELAGAGYNVYTSNFCAKCNTKAFGACVTGTPKPVKQQWCCYDSKVALDINIAAYDQGILNIYTGNDRFGSQMQLSNNNTSCGGIKVADIEKIDFSKADYFKDLMNSIDMNKVVDMKNFTNASVMTNTQNRSQKDTSSFVDEWRKKYAQ